MKYLNNFRLFENNQIYSFNSEYLLDDNIKKENMQTKWEGLSEINKRIVKNGSKFIFDSIKTKSKSTDLFWPSNFQKIFLDNTGKNVEILVKIKSDDKYADHIDDHDDSEQDAKERLLIINGIVLSEFKSYFNEYDDYYSDLNFDYDFMSENESENDAKLLERLKAIYMTII